MLRAPPAAPAAAVPAPAAHPKAKRKLLQPSPRVPARPRLIPLKRSMINLTWPKSKQTQSELRTWATSRTSCLK